MGEAILPVGAVALGQGVGPAIKAALDGTAHSTGLGAGNGGRLTWTTAPSAVRINIKINSNIKINRNGGGQECPPHIGSVHWALRAHAGIEFDLAEGAFVAGHVLLQESE